MWREQQAGTNVSNEYLQSTFCFPLWLPTAQYMAMNRIRWETWPGRLGIKCFVLYDSCNSGWYQVTFNEVSFTPVTFYVLSHETFTISSHVTLCLLSWFKPITPVYPSWYLSHMFAAQLCSPFLLNCLMCEMQFQKLAHHGQSAN